MRAEQQTAGPTRTAVIGVGYLGRFHAQKYAQLAESKLVGVVDANADVAAKVAAELGVPSFNDHRAILDQVDAVSLAVPTPLHHAIGKDLLARGVHVLIEKPIATTVAEARELVGLAKTRGCVLQVGHL
jgi:predicted dehydrogenase